MLDFTENRKVTKDEIADLNRQGHKLDEKKTYVLKFGFNDKWNNAADPRPFRIKTSLIKKLADDGIGMPYIWNPEDSTVHVRGTTEGRNDTAADLLEIQSKYTVGVNAAHIITKNNNVYYIVEIWPEYEDRIDHLPPFTSPTIFPLKEDADGIEDAQFLNINAVDNPGYSKVLAGITGVCKNGIKRCMEELAPLAAAGKLETSRHDPESFSKIKRNIGLAMSAEGEITLPNVAKMVQDHAKILNDHTEKLNQFGTDLATIKNAVAPAKPEGDKPMGAAGEQGTIQLPKELMENPAVKKLVEEHETTKKTLAEIKEEREAEKKKALENLRKTQAESIVTKLISLKRIKPDDKDKEIKKYVDLKDEAGNLKDLEVLDNFLKSETPQTEGEVVGAAGYYDFPELTGDKNTTPVHSNTEIMESTEVI